MGGRDLANCSQAANFFFHRLLYGHFFVSIFILHPKVFDAMIDSKFFFIDVIFFLRNDFIHAEQNMVLTFD